MTAIIGFLLIAFEWRHMFQRDVSNREYEIHRGFELQQQREGLEASVPRSLEEETTLMAREFSKLHSKEVKYRKSLFYPGMVLVILGFILQSMGSWPVADPLFGLKSCS